MPWKECSVMDERLRFVARLIDGDSMTEVCRDFGISRKTGYKIFARSRIMALKRSPTGLDARCATPISYRPRSRA